MLTPTVPGTDRLSLRDEGGVMAWLRYWLWYRWQRRTFITAADLRILERHFGVRYDNDTGVFSRLR